MTHTVQTLEDYKGEPVPEMEHTVAKYLSNLEQLWIALMILLGKSTRTSAK